METFDLMWRVGGGWRRVAGAALRPFHMTLAQYELTWLTRRRGALPPSVAAAELGWDRPTLSLVARGCLAAGWLKRTRSSKDRRGASLELSGKGEELLDRIESRKPFAVEALGDSLDIIGSDERALLARLLDRVARRAGDLWRR